MQHIITIAAVLLPQIWCAKRRFTTAAHLTYLLGSLICITAFHVFAPTGLTGPPRGDLSLTYVGFAAMGLAGLVPLFWALQQMFPTYGYSLSAVMAQALSLVLAAALVTLSAATLPSPIEAASLLLIVALYGVALHVVTYGTLE